jgi:hypothetical protein
MSELSLHDPFVLPDEFELEHEVQRPRWWYAQQLRMAGASWDEIAKALGYANAQSAQTAVQKAKRVRSKEEMEDIIDLELERLDMLQLVFWRQAAQGDIKAGQFVLNCMGLRMKLLGTEKRPNEAQVGTSNTAIFIGGDSNEYVKQLQQAREMVFNKQKEVE